MRIVSQLVRLFFLATVSDCSGIIRQVIRRSKRQNVSDLKAYLLKRKYSLSGIPDNQVQRTATSPGLAPSG